MSPKKAAAAPKADAVGDDANLKFTWTVENERKLLLLCMGRPNLNPNDYREFINALPAGANYNGVRIKVSKFRIEQRAIYAEQGWTAPDGKPATAANETPKGKKRAATDDNDDADGGTKPQKSAKKARGKATAKIIDEDANENGPTNDFKSINGFKSINDFKSLDDGIKMEEIEEYDDV
ncbi:hypothetical protein P280DRAFT_481775 [Massarina eburnea CBS 473.64]|uniref:Uncharacterized protein n=1 Tax=Massarina eburnea CBS 473.64 TaxID=1395130 RepID=A0A6A6RYE8_9PLEO|nr:hypothetical protein P280DRAFT_481775 [Massarina eburnea CBS 473.64]